MARLDWDKARKRDNRSYGPHHNVIPARHDGTCPWCPKAIYKGQPIAYSAGFWGHHDCIHPECAAHPAGRTPKTSVTSRNALHRARRQAR